MLTQEITRYKPAPLPAASKVRYVVGSRQHKQYILEKTYEEVINNDIYDPGSIIYMKGQPGRGMVMQVHKDLQDVEWDGLKVKFIELWFESNNSCVLAHPSELRRKK